MLFYSVLSKIHLSRQKFSSEDFLLRFGDAKLNPGSVNQRNSGSFSELLSL